MTKTINKIVVVFILFAISLLGLLKINAQSSPIFIGELLPFDGIQPLLRPYLQDSLNIVAVTDSMFQTDFQCQKRSFIKEVPLAENLSVIGLLAGYISYQGISGNLTTLEGTSLLEKRQDYDFVYRNDTRITDTAGLSSFLFKDSKVKTRPNVVLITLDDMGYGTTGIEGSNVPGITPYIDKLASEGITFTRGYVMSPMCGPSRAAILSGRYPHRSGMMGHGTMPPALWEEPEVKSPSISTYLHDNGYTTGAILKLRRSKYMNTWDTEYKEFPFGVGYHDRNPKSFYTRTKNFIKAAKKSKKPFFLYANPIDPHRPWDNTAQEKEMLAKWNPDKKYPEPSRKYTADEIEVPEFLLELPEIREALVSYYNALNRGDECVGSILQAIDDSDMRDNTLVIFLSDHGMGAPGAKNTLYQDGIRTPIIIRWPKKIQEGVIDEKSIVSAIDLVPTILDALGLPPLEAIEGKSIIDVILGKSAQTDRKYAYASSNYRSSSTPEEFFPHRAIIDESFCYIFNSYVVRSGGKKKKGSGWMDVVNSSLSKSEKLKNKIDYMEYRDPEELYNLKEDPGCWHNLAQDPDYAEKLKEYRKKLYKEMKETADPELSVFNNFK